MRVLLTGATGFVGRGLIERLGRAETPLHIRGLTRIVGSFGGPSGLEWARCSDLADKPAIAAAVQGVDVVIHAAGRAHVMEETAADPLTAFRKVNTEGTLTLANASAQAGAKRFVFISSIKVNGEGTEPERPYRADDTPAPADPYGVSKLEAERGLRELAGATRMEIVIIRPPLLYGPGVKGNFLTMMKALKLGIPLPLGAIRNKRSLAARDNLVDLVATCLDHRAAANETFLVSDGEDLSTTELLRRTANALGVAPRLVPIPTALLSAAATVLGKGHVSRRLCGSLQVDITKTTTLLDWAPPVAVDEALKQAARHFLGTALEPERA